MKLVHQHQNSLERKMKWHLNSMKFKPNQTKEYKFKPTSKQSKLIPIQSSERKTNEESKLNFKGP